MTDPTDVIDRQSIGDDPRRPLNAGEAEHKDRQVCHIQRILMFHLNLKTTEAREAAVLACAWERLQNRLDRMKGRPEPKAVDVTKLTRPQRERPIELPTDS